MSGRNSTPPRSSSPGKKTYNPLKGKTVNKSHFSSGVVDKTIREQKAAQNRLVIKLFEGKNLLASDAETGKSDPICFMWLGSADSGMPDWEDVNNPSVLRSAVCPTTVDPIWRSEHAFTLGEMNLTDRLLVYLRDEDIEADGSCSYDALGLLQFTMKDILSQGKKVNNSGVVLGPIWKDLTRYPGMRKVDGKIKLTLTLHFGTSEESMNAVKNGLLGEEMNSATSISELIDATQHLVDPISHPLRQSSPARSSRRPSSASPGRSRSNSRASTPTENVTQPEDFKLPVVDESETYIDDMPPPQGGDEAFPSFGAMKDTVSKFFGSSPQETSPDTPMKSNPDPSATPAVEGAVSSTPAPLASSEAESQPAPNPTEISNVPTGQSSEPASHLSGPAESIVDPVSNASTTDAAANTPSPMVPNQHVEGSVPGSRANNAAVSDPQPVSMAPKSSGLPGQGEPASQQAPPNSTYVSKESYRLVISDIAVKNLKDTGNFLDKQDPAVRIKVGESTMETDRAKDAGTAASFSESFEFNVSEEVMLKGLISVDVVNKGKNNKDKSLIGTGTTQLSGISGNITATSCTVPLSIGSDKVGEASFKCTITAPPGVPPQPTGVVSASQSPPVVAEVPLQPVAQPSTQTQPVPNPTEISNVPTGQSSEPASHLSGPAESIVDPVSNASTTDAAANTPSPMVPNQHVEGSVPGSRANNAAVSDPQPVSMAPKSSGLPGQGEPASQQAPPNSTYVSKESYRLVISDIAVKNLKDTGNFLDKQDPAVRIKVGESTMETDRAKDAGTAASFSESFEFNVSEEVMLKGLISVDVVNKGKNNKDKSLIGTGTTQLSGISGNITATSCTVPLSIGSDKVGEASFKCTITAPPGVPPQPTGVVSASQSPPVVAEVPPQPVAQPSTQTQSATLPLQQQTPLQASQSVNTLNDPAHPSRTTVQQVSTGNKTSGNVSSNPKNSRTNTVAVSQSTKGKSKEDKMIADLKQKLAKANSEAIASQRELEKLKKEVEFKALQAQLQHKEDQNKSTNEQMEHLRATLAQISGEEQLSLPENIRVTDPTTGENMTVVSGTSGKKNSRAASAKRAEDAKVRVKEARKQVAERGGDSKTVIMVKSKNGKKGEFYDEDVNEEEYVDDSAIVRQNTLQNSKPSETQARRAVSFPTENASEEELLVIDNSNNNKTKKRKVDQENTESIDNRNIDTAGNIDALRYPLRAQKGSLMQPNSSILPDKGITESLPPDRYPLRPSSSILKEVSELRKSTEDTVGALLSRLNSLENSLTTQLESNILQPESTNDGMLSNATQAPLLNKTAPPSLQGPPSYKPTFVSGGLGSPALAPAPPIEPRSSKLNWHHISRSLQAGELHSAVADVLHHGYREDVVTLMKALGPVPQSLSVAHRNSIYETISRVLCSEKQGYNSVTIATDMHYPSKDTTTICMAWVFELVKQGLTPTLTRTCHSRLLNSLKQVSKNRVDNDGVLASRYEFELKNNRTWG